MHEERRIEFTFTREEFEKFSWEPLTIAQLSRLRCHHEDAGIHVGLLAPLVEAILNKFARMVVSHGGTSEAVAAFWAKSRDGEPTYTSIFAAGAREWLRERDALRLVHESELLQERNISTTPALRDQPSVR